MKISAEDFQAALKENLIFRGIYNQGRQDGRTHLVLLQLREKFGELPAWVIIWLQHAKLSEIEKVAVRIPQAETLTAVFPAAAHEVASKNPLPASTER